MTTMTWTVLSMTCYPQAEGETDVVFNVFWQCTGQETVGNDPTISQTYNGRVAGSTPVAYTAGSPYTPYDQLTQDQVLGWVWGAGVNKDETEAQVQAQIDAAINPPVVTPPLPWAPAQA